MLNFNNINIIHINEITDTPTKKKASKRNLGAKSPVSNNSCIF